MEEFVTIIVVCVLLPLVIILHYVTKWKATKSLTNEDASMLEDVWENTQRMETRINSLETILDDQVPDWRRKV